MESSPSCISIHQSFMYSFSHQTCVFAEGQVQTVLLSASLQEVLYCSRHTSVGIPAHVDAI